MSDHLPNLLIILSIFTVGVASPGPATLMILTVGATRGRAAAVSLAFGIVAGSMVWACVAAMGLVAAMAVSAIAFTVLKLGGGLYLLYLAFRSLRSAMSATAPMPRAVSGTRQRSFFEGLLLHLTNPKAPLVWMATLSVGLGATAPPAFLVTAILACESVAVIVFVGYAVLFSSPPAIRIYAALRRPLDAVVGVLFGAAGVKILTLKTA